MIEKIRKKNNDFLRKPKKYFLGLGFSIIFMSLFSVFFLFMTISFKYSVLEKSKKFDELLVKNSILESKLFNLEQEKYEAKLNKELFLSSNIKYLNSYELAMNYSR